MLRTYDPLMPNLNDRSRNPNAEYFRGRKPQPKRCTATEHRISWRKKKDKTDNIASRVALKTIENGTLPSGGATLPKLYQEEASDTLVGPRFDDCRIQHPFRTSRNGALPPYVPIPGVLQQPTRAHSAVPSNDAATHAGSKRRRFHSANTTRSHTIDTSRTELVRGSTVLYILDYATELYSSAEQILDEMQENTFEEVIKLAWNKHDIEAVLAEARKQGWDETIQLQFDEGLGEIEFLAGGGVSWFKQEDLDRWDKAEPIDATVAGCDVQGWWTRLESSENRHWEIWRETSIGRGRGRGR